MMDVPELINIFTEMSKYASYSISQTIDVVLTKGAEKLYHRYLDQKLPDHAHVQNYSTFQNNLKMHEVKRPIRQLIQSVPLTIVQPVPKDNRVPNKIPLKISHEQSTLSPKNTTFAKSTKYQTFIQSQRSNLDKRKNPEEDSMFLEQNFGENMVGRITERPSTMQVGRKNKNEFVQMGSKIREMDQKRAATCHVRKRKAVTKDRFIKIKEQNSLHLKQEMERSERLRKWKIEKQQEEQLKQEEGVKFNAYMKMKFRKAQQNYQELKNKVKGKKQYQVTNFENSNGHIFINEPNKSLKRNHIIQIHFNPQEQNTIKSLEPKVMTVSTTKAKRSCVSKLKNKVKISNEQYTNNGSRQISTIPFMNLNHGIVLSESEIQAKASRRRPDGQISREKYTIQNNSNRFKSHIPIVNSARIDLFATIDDHLKETVGFTFKDNSENKEFETTLGSRKEMQGSILWKARSQSEDKKIRVSNPSVFFGEILQGRVIS